MPLSAVTCSVLNSIKLICTRRAPINVLLVDAPKMSIAT
jgi:hypothetical protein